MFLVTGANGFIGQTICFKLEADGLPHKRAVRSKVSLARLGHDAQQSVVIGDVDSQTDWSIALNQVECVIHCVGRQHVMDENAADPLKEYRLVNVDGTLNLARQAIKNGVTKFIYISSAKVNGEQTEFDCPINEDHDNNPRDAYTISKFEAELGLMELAAGSSMSVIIIRPPLVYGPGVKGNFSSLVKVINQRIPLPFGSISNKRSFLAVDNLVDFIITCARKKEISKLKSEVFLVTDEEDVSTTELLTKVAKAYKKHGLLLPVPVSVLSFFAALFGKTKLAERLFGNFQVDGTKAQKILGWKPKVTMDEQLVKMALYDVGKD